ncbi:type II toxin-antitoxin system HipA family toxin [Stenotrophomonas sp. ZAC14D2_NAIMI4_7]|uniref:HipA domain-containing protein n=1 Tax=Stenotrophomonas sp. ZAC14D2_NAIMI4_7 TaxID=2072405 RepID=UPI000D53D418|nr:HipA domain-containing protein [Stenotrophomonas sp. ZAC14D2_NAIMI4_7]AWH15984.1 type II toxin-antitoxin system HipA family toxin [Stenotrophomonas sp. ZAC14D2_NAIMI4_7]
MSHPPIHVQDVPKVCALSGLHVPAQLQVSIDDTLVGTLAEAGDLWRFNYAPQWLSDAARFALAPALPLQEGDIVDGGSDRPVQWYFDNLLPEEQQRTLMASDARLDSANAFALLAHYGAESAGSLTLLPPGQSLSPGSREVLADAELSQRIRGLPRTSLAAGAAKRMLLAGAQHKLAVIEQDGQLYQPLGAEPSTHILKPDSTSDGYPHSVANEWFVMRLAGRMGLQVPRVERRYVPEPVFIIERFDRVVTANAVHRRHAIDACQLLNLAASFKYSLGSIDTLAAIVQHCRSKLATRLRLFDWLVFNVLTGNNDAHLKNLSFLVDSEGIELAPHYDLLSTACYETAAFEGPDARWPTHSEMAWPILGMQHFHTLRFDDLVAAGVALGLPPQLATRRLSDQVERIGTEARALYAQVQQDNAAWLQRFDMGATLEGEAHLLRTLIHVVIDEMVRQLARR